MAKIDIRLSILWMKQWYENFWKRLGGENNN